MSEFEHEGSTELVAAGGVELFVRRFGDPALPLLIVVHGGPTWDHSYLLPALVGLADLAHVVLFDLRGCGCSSRTAPVGGLPVAALQPGLVADDVAALIRHYGAARADVLGFSYGGGVAMRLVDQYPGMVGSLILASTTASSAQRGKRPCVPLAVRRPCVSPYCDGGTLVIPVGAWTSFTASLK